MTKLGICPICKIVGLLLVIGALNWGSVAVANVNFVNRLLGSYPLAEKIVYILIGLSGLVGLLSCVKQCPCACAKKT